jgi:transposase
MPYSIAGIDVHKKMLAVVIADVAVEAEYNYERRKFGATLEELRRLAEWLLEREVQEVVMESTAQYWRPVWGMLEQYWRPVLQRREGAGAMAGKLHLAQAKSNRGRRGRKNDYRDAERLVRRLVANELVLSFVPDPEQRLWRTLTRRKQQVTKDLVQFQNRLEALLEQMHIKLSGQVSDLLGVSGRRMLQALAEGATDPAAVAALADPKLRATQEQLRDALAACVDLLPVYRRLLKMEMQQLKFLEEQTEQLEREIAALLAPHGAAVQRLAEIPGLGVKSAQQIVAELGPAAAVFPSEGDLASWVGVCPGDNVTAGKAHSTRSPQGNKNMRRLLNQAAHAAVKMKGSIFELVLHRYLARRMEYQEAIWCIAHRLCRLIWKVLHQGVRYEERGPGVQARAKRLRIAKMIKELTKAGYSVQLATLPQATPVCAR